MNNPFNLSEEKLVELLKSYDTWLKSDPKEARYPEAIREQTKLIKEDFLNKELLLRLNDNDLYSKIYNYSRKLEGRAYRVLPVDLLQKSIKKLRRNLEYLLSSEDDPAVIAQNIIEGKFKIKNFSKAFWSPILQAQFPEVLPNWNNKTGDFLSKLDINISTYTLSTAEKYKKISEAFKYLMNLMPGHDFYTINHLMHYGTAIKEGSDLIETLKEEKPVYMITASDPFLNIISSYKEHIKKTRLEDEIYKWELLDKFNGRPDLEKEDFASEITGIDYNNLMYPIALGVRKHLANIEPLKYKECFTELFDESKSLSIRIKEFQDRILKLYRKYEPTHPHHHDERTIATFLTFHNPEKYTFYKSSFYTKVCKLIKENSKETGEKYVHYLEIIYQFRDKYVVADKELKTLVLSFMKPGCYGDPNYLLLSQDILYQMLEKDEESGSIQNDEEVELINRLRSIGNRKMTEDHFIILSRCVDYFDLKNEDPRLSFSTRNSNNCLTATINQRYIISSGSVIDNGRSDLNVTWLLIPSSYNDKLEEHKCFIKRSDGGGFKPLGNETNSPLWVAFENHELNSDKTITDIWLSGIKPELERGTLSSFRKYHNSKYFKAVTDLSYRTRIMDIAFGKKIKNMNLILYGPPGTGKTYHSIDYAVRIADPSRYIEGNHEENREIYEDLVQKGQIIFTTFHQSMSYEDFIEGIKPACDDSQGLTYSVEDGLFKQLSVNAAFEFVGKKSSAASKSLSFSYVYDRLLDEVAEKHGKGEGYSLQLRSGSIIEIIDITLSSNFLIRHNNGSRTYTVSRRRLEKLFSELPDLNLITNINQEIRKVIGGSNASAYWAVLIKLRSYKTDIEIRNNGKDYSYEDKSIAIGKLLPDDIIHTGNEKNYVLIIDEINRGNVSQIFGELITLIEDDKRFGEKEGLTAKLPYSKSRFFVPPNLYLIGTMNTADRSIEALDTALRRRFSFIEMVPKNDLDGMGNEYAGTSLSKLLETINNRIEKLIDRDHRIGHSYFLGIQSTDDLMLVFKNKILPLLQEYFYGNYEKMGLVLGGGFIYKLADENVIFARFPADENDFNDKVIYRINTIALESQEEFISAIALLLNR